MRTLVRGKYFDGLAIMRSQDNFVVQWGDPADDDQKKPLGAGKKMLTAEFDRSAKGVPFIALPDPDTYAPQTGFVSGFPAARDKEDGTAWLVHCYSMVGAVATTTRTAAAAPSSTWFQAMRRASSIATSR